MPDTAVSLYIAINDEIVTRCLANQYRPDLEKAAIGKGRHGFDITFDPPLSPLERQTVAVRREGDGVHFSRSPFVLEPSLAFDRKVQEYFEQILSITADQVDLARRLSFLTHQADRLRQIHAYAQSGAAERRISRNHEQAVLLDVEAQAAKPRALIIDDRMPLPNRDAGSNAILSHMRALQRLGYDITFAPVDLHGDASALEAEGVTCCLHPWYASIEEVLRRQRDAFALVYLHRVSTAARYVVLARDHQPKARIVYSVADLHHLRLAGQAKVEHRPELTRLSERLRIMELAAAWQSDAVITHSTTEAEVLRRHIGARRVHVIPWTLTPRPTPTPFVERLGLAFIGDYRHRPNVDAAHWLIEHIMPEIEAQGLVLPCLLFGGNMPESLREPQRPHVDPVGYVPELATALDRVRLTVAPLAYGAGVKGKVLDSLAAGIPCVCTPAAAEGLDLPDILLGQVASTPSKLASAIRALHEDEAWNKACSQAGLDYIAATTNEARIDRLLQGAIGLRTPFSDA